MKSKTPDLTKALMDFELKSTDLKSGWKITELSAEKAANHMQYVQRMVKEQKERVGDFKLPVSKIQSASTQRLLDMTDEELAEYRQRKIDLKKAIVDAETNAKANAHGEARKQSQSGRVAEDLRRQPKNDRGDAFTDGYTGVAGDTARKEKATNAFMETKAALRPIEKAMIATSDPKEFHHKEAKEEKPRPLWRRILDGRFIWTADDHEPEWKSRK